MFQGEAGVTTDVEDSALREKVVDLHSEVTDMGHHVSCVDASITMAQQLRHLCGSICHHGGKTNALGRDGLQACQRALSMLVVPPSVFHDACCHNNHRLEVENQSAKRADVTGKPVLS